MRIFWKRLYEQFALNPARAATDKNAVNDFRAKAIRELIKIKIAWPGLDYATPRGALELLPSTIPSVPALTKAGRSRSGDPPDSSFCTTAAVHTTCS